MNKQALFVMLPTKSHYIPCQGLAKDLAKNGYDVSFTGTNSVQGYVEQNGFKFVQFKYMPTYLVSSLKSFFAILIKSFLDHSYKDQRYKEFVQSINDAQTICAELKPDIIFLDEHLGHYYFYFLAISPKIYLVNTKLSTRKISGIPPLNIFYIAKNSILSFFISELLWQKHLFFKRMRVFFNEVAFLGQSNEYFQRSYVRMLNLSIKTTDKNAMYDYDSLIGVKTIILMSYKFDYCWRKQVRDELYINYWNTPLNVTVPDSLNYIFDNKINGSKIIYCAIGTLAGNDPKPYIRFLQEVIRALENQPNYKLLISTGSKYITSQLINSTASARVYFYEDLPQTSILPYCDVLITHGGLNSIKEGIEANIPMLGFTNLNHIYKDTSGNIARLVYHKIGLRCKVSDNAQVIYNLIEDLLINPIYKRNSASLKLNLMDNVKFIDYLIQIQ